MNCAIAGINWGDAGKAELTAEGSLRRIARVVYDITSKPPAMVEWE